MKNTFLLLLLLFISPIMAQDYSKEILAIVLPNNKLKSPIKTKGCKYQKEKWAQLLLTKKSFTEDIKFNKACDLQGKFSPQMEQYFNAPLKINGHKNINNINLNIKFSIVFEDKALLKINLKDSLIQTKDNKKINFKLNYTYELDLLNKDPLSKSRGGSLTINSINNKKTNNTIKLK